MSANAGEGAEELIRRMVELGMAKSKDEAVDLLEEYGRAEVERRIKEEEEVQKLVEKWLKEGVPVRGVGNVRLKGGKDWVSVVPTERDKIYLSSREARTVRRR